MAISRNTIALTMVFDNRGDADALYEAYHANPKGSLRYYDITSDSVLWTIEKGPFEATILPKDANEEDPKIWIAQLAYILELAALRPNTMSEGLYTFIEYQEALSWAGVININNEKILTVSSVAGNGDIQSVVVVYKGSPRDDKRGLRRIKNLLDF